MKLVINSDFQSDCRKATRFLYLFSLCVISVGGYTAGFHPVIESSILSSRALNESAQFDKYPQENILEILWKRKEQTKESFISFTRQRV